MRITSVNIPTKLSQMGLSEIKMTRLKQVVLLAGKNGAGKSRILRAIAATIGHKPTITAINDWKKKIAGFNAQISMLEEALPSLRTMVENSGGTDQKRKNQIVQAEKQITSLNTSIKETQDSINWNFVETEELSNSYNVVWNVPKKLDFLDSESLTNKDNRQRAARAKKSVGIALIADNATSYIKTIQELWWETQHPLSSAKTEDKLIALDDYNRLVDLLKVFLLTDLGRSSNGVPTLFGFPISEANLSDGQKVLLQICVQIHAQQHTLDKLIFFLDEPENHLHPSAVTEMIERLIQVAPNGQVWIATHSINILANYDPTNIWWVEDGKISFGTKVSERVLDGLIGDDEKIAKLRDFIALGNSMALARYAYESLFDPVSVGALPGDPQILQVRERISAAANAATKIRVLDYGAGKGRILAGLLGDLNGNDEPITTAMDYVALEKESSDCETCRGVIREAYGSDDGRYFSSRSALLSRYAAHSFDVVIMCNVLHEIDPKEWLKLFGSDGEIAKFLKPDGVLLLLEDHEIPIGEKAYPNGFIVLDTPQLRELFMITEGDDFGFHDARGDGRIKIHILKRACIERITSESRIAALKSLNREARDNILEIRQQGDKSYRSGSRHGFWLLQLANSTLALSELDN